MYEYSDSGTSATYRLTNKIEDGTGFNTNESGSTCGSRERPETPVPKRPNPHMCVRVPVGIPSVVPTRRVGDRLITDRNAATKLGNDRTRAA